MFPFRITEFMSFRIAHFPRWDFTVGSQTVVLSSFVNQADDLQNCEMFCEDGHSVKPELNSEIEEADAGLIPT